MNIKFLPFLFLGTVAHAAIVKPLDSLRTIEIPIAKEGLTRIAVQDDRILNVFGVTGEYVLEVDEDQGQIFIQPADLGISKPLSLTITTERGHTQDLRLLPKDQAPEALILEVQKDGVERKYFPYENAKSPLSPLSLLPPISHTPISRNEIEELFQACKEEKIPIGYKLVSIDWKKSVVPDPQGKSQLDDAKNFLVVPLLMRELRGEELRGLTYELKNTDNTSLTLSETELVKSLDLKRNSIIAILMTKKSLAPGERTSVYVVAKSLE